MSAALHVRRLCLRAPERELVPAGRSLLEQAFRLVDWPGADTPGQLFIRKLELGGLPLDMPAAQLALQLTVAMQALASRAVPFDADGAAHANAVRVDHPVHALFALIERACAPRPLDVGAWFWPKIVPELAQAPTRRAVQQIALARLCQLPEAPFLLSELLVTLLRARTADTFLDQLSAEDDRVCAQALRVLTVAPAPTGFTTPMMPALVEPALRALAARHVPVWGPAHVRSRWFCQLALLAERPARALDPRLHEQAALLVRQLSAAAPRVAFTDQRRTALPDTVPGPKHTSTPPLPAARPTDQPEKPRHVAERVTDSPLEHTPSAAESVQPPTAANHPAAVTQTRKIESVTAPLLTEFGGLPFLLNVLSRLGIAEFLAQHPDLIEIELARRVLLRVCERLEVPAGDPVRSTLQLTAASTPERCVFTLPAGWRALFDEPHVEPDAHNSQALELLLDAWQAALECWLERYARMKVSEVARRAAGIIWSRTHLDLVFDLEDADATLRRAALDLNPGYLPWFGRVVTFHYVRGTAWGVRAAQSGGDAD